MGEHRPTVGGNIVPAILMDNSRGLGGGVDAPLVCQPAAVECVSTEQTHGGDQYDDQRIHCFYLFPFFHAANRSGAQRRPADEAGPQGVKKALVHPEDLPWAEDRSRRRRLTHPLHIVDDSAPRYHFACCRWTATPTHGASAMLPGNGGWTALHYSGRSGPRSHTLLAGEGHLLLTAAVASKRAAR